MRVFFVELHTLAVSIIGVLRRVVVPEIMPNVMPRMQYAMAAKVEGAHPAGGGLCTAEFAENRQAPVVLTFGT